MDSFVVIEKNGSRLKLNARLVDSIEPLKPLMNGKAWMIFRELVKRESYPAEIAKQLGLGQQEAYYYINKLKAAGLVKVVKKEERQGGLAKFYAASDNCFALVPALDEIGRNIRLGGRQEAKDFYDLFYLSNTFMRLSKFVFRYCNRLTMEGVIRWFRTYSRMDMKTGLLELDLKNKVDYRVMESHFKHEIDKILEKEIEGI